MAFDPTSACARTAAGDAELSLPALGLSLGQRRLLTLLQSPAAAAELAQKYQLEPVRLERDLTRLADLHLVERQGAAIASPPAAVPDGGSMTPVVIGGSPRRVPAKALAAGTVALLVATGIWYGTRSGEPSSRPVPAAVVTTLAPTTRASDSVPPQLAPQLPNEAPNGPARVANESTAVVGVPATATVLRGNAAPPERRVEIRPGLYTSAASAPPSAPSARPATIMVPAAVPVTVAAGAPAAAPAASPAVVPAIPTTATPLTTAFTSAAPRAEPPPPVQVAAASPAPVPRPAAPVPLKAISREQPEFPKEAAADGLKTGAVTARLHVDARGKVTGVDIVNAEPPRVFDRAVRRALLQWQFEPPASGGNADVDVDIKFQRD